MSYKRPLKDAMELAQYVVRKIITKKQAKEAWKVMEDNPEESVYNVLEEMGCFKFNVPEDFLKTKD